MKTQHPWNTLLDRLADHLSAHNTTDDPDKKAGNKRLVNILRDVCAVVRDTQDKATTELPAVVERAHDIIDSALQHAYSHQGSSSILTFAHSDSEPFVEDALEHAGSDVLDAFVKFYTDLLKPSTPAPRLPAFARICSWTRTPHPHPLTTPLSRFRGGFSPSATHTTSFAYTIYNARAQLTVDPLPSALQDLALSSGGSILATTYGGGWKARNPRFGYYFLADQASDYLEGVVMDPGLSNVAHFIATDEDRKLVFLADEQRVKSFSFSPHDDGITSKHLPNIHTMNSQGTFDGPLLVLPGGRIVRAGTGKMAVWNLDALQAHQDHPGQLIGEGKVSLSDSAREPGCNDVEMSTGSLPDIVSPFSGDPEHSFGALHLHRPSGHLLCGEDPQASGGYACMSVDLEHGGKRVARYLGHGRKVAKFATSPGDSNMFATAGSDGYARLFDVRRPLPVLTFNTGLQREACKDVVFIHPDGIPTLFTGGDVTQQVKMWDVRAKECVYELSTGNNAVSRLAWDSLSSSLYVATECRYVNRMGIRLGYRPARIPSWATWKAVDKEYKKYNQMAKDGTLSPQDQQPYGGKDYPDVYDDYLDDPGEEEEESDEETDIDQAYSADMRWPQKCFHKESFFGYGYDAGEHVLFRWQFKDIPDITQLPASTTCD